MNGENARQPGERGRNRSSGLLILLFALCALGIVVMLIAGTRALNMSGPAMELNKLLDRKSKVCADRARLAECEAILGRIKALERETAKRRAGD